MDISLQCLADPHAVNVPPSTGFNDSVGQTLPVINFSLAEDQSVTVGRMGGGAEIPLPAYPSSALYCSRRHVLLTCTRVGSLILKDLNSSNGTFVNAIRIQERCLRDNDIILFGGDRTTPIGQALDERQRTHTALIPWRIRFQSTTDVTMDHNQVSNRTKSTKSAATDLQDMQSRSSCDDFKRSRKDPLIQEPIVVGMNESKDCALNAPQDEIDEGRLMDAFLSEPVSFPFPIEEDRGVTRSTKALPSVRLGAESYDLLAGAAAKTRRGTKPQGFASVEDEECWFIAPPTLEPERALVPKTDNELVDQKASVCPSTTLNTAHNPPPSKPHEESSFSELIPTRTHEHITHALSHSPRSPSVDFVSTCTEPCANAASVTISPGVSADDFELCKPKSTTLRGESEIAFDDIRPRALIQVRIGYHLSNNLHTRLQFTASSWYWTQDSPNPNETAEVLSLTLPIHRIQHIHYALEGAGSGRSVSTTTYLLAITLSGIPDRVAPSVFVADRVDRHPKRPRKMPMDSLVEVATLELDPSYRPHIIYFFRRRVELCTLVTDLRENYPTTLWRRMHHIAGEEMERRFIRCFMQDDVES